MINTPSLEKLSEDIYSAITLVLILLDKIMRRLNFNMGPVVVGYNVGNIKIVALENKYKDQLIELSDSIYEIAVFTGGRWFRSKMEFVNFLGGNIPEGQFHWFVYIVS